MIRAAERGIHEGGFAMTLIPNLNDTGGLRRVLLALAVVAAAVSLGGAAAQAQATRTWVSGVGDDANPCSRIAPCKTFAGAISKTAAAGEIDCLDSGGFGAVTITKSITIYCEGVVGGELVSGTNAIVVAAGATDRVILHGLDIDGTGTGINGIRFLSGAALLVDKCIIYGFTTNGIDIALTGSGGAEVRDTVITYVGGDGIKVGATGGTAALTVDHVNIAAAVNGVEVAAGGFGTVSYSHIFATGNGALASGTGAVLNVDNTRLVNNATGASASAAGATIALSNDSLYGNNVAVAAVPGSFFVTGQNNKLADNASNGATPTSNMTTE